MSELTYRERLDQQREQRREKARLKRVRCEAIRRESYRACDDQCGHWDCWPCEDYVARDFLRFLRIARGGRCG